MHKPPDGIGPRAMISSRRSMQLALNAFFDDREALGWHLGYLGEGVRREPQLMDTVTWARVDIEDGETFRLPGSCWSWDSYWISEVKRCGDRVNAGLDRYVVLSHCVRLALAMNPMSIADRFAVSPMALASQIAAHLVLQRLGASNGA